MLPKHSNVYRCSLKGLFTSPSKISRSGKVPEVDRGQLLMLRHLTRLLLVSKVLELVEFRAGFMKNWGFHGKHSGKNGDLLGFKLI